MPAHRDDPAWLQTLLALMQARQIASWAALARLAEVGETYCRMMGQGLQPGPEVRAKVARALGVDQMSIWPALEPGKRRTRHRRIKLRPGEKIGDK